MTGRAVTIDGLPRYSWEALPVLLRKTGAERKRIHHPSRWWP
jgi:hypothetical protein